MNDLINFIYLRRSLSNALPLAKSSLARHKLVEVQAGSLVLSPEIVPVNEKVETSDGGLGYWQIIILAMSGVIFLGALIALGTICSLKYKR